LSCPVTKMKKMKFVLVIVCLAMMLTSCQKDDSLKVDKILTFDYGGQVNKIETLGYYSAADAVSLLQLSNLKGKIETTSGFYLYRLTYKSKNFDNTAIWVSGLLAVPESKNIKGIVSWQHGTNPDRNEAPSKPTPAEGIAISALFAGNEYILLAPDYIGLGSSQLTPTYLHTQSTVNAAIDFINIGSVILKKLTTGSNSNLYLTGFSQGGAATLGVHRALELNNTTGLNLKASAGVAGAYNFKDISIPYAISNNSVLYLGYVANSYAHIYNQNLNSIVKPEYAGLLPTLFDGSKTLDVIEQALPEKAEQLYNQNMISDIKNGVSNWFTDALGQNETYKWKPIAKVRLFYGNNDTDVSPQDAVSAFNYMKNIGGNAELVNTGNYDHTETLLQSLPEIQKWFNNSK
jgi:hypothetical protein